MKNTSRIHFFNNNFNFHATFKKTQFIHISVSHEIVEKKPVELKLVELKLVETKVVESRNSSKAN